MENLFYYYPPNKKVNKAIRWLEFLSYTIFEIKRNQNKNFNKNYYRKLENIINKLYNLIIKLYKDKKVF